MKTEQCQIAQFHPSAKLHTIKKLSKVFPVSTQEVVVLDVEGEKLVHPKCIKFFETETKVKLKAR